MTKISIKLIPGLVLAILVLVQMPLPASAAAASNADVIAATDEGIDYLADNQNNDGSVAAGFGGVTEWPVVAIAAKGQDPAEFDNGSGNSTLDYLKNNVTPPTAPATDVERKVIAIAAAGEDTKDFNGEDYNAKLETYHNNNQIGDPTLLNDDIFGVIAIDATKDGTLKSMAQDGYDYFLAHQQADGGFSYTTDTCAFCGSDSNDTAAAIIAIYAANNIKLTHADIDQIKAKALAYLLSTQQTDGGFGYDGFSPSDGSSTSWALMALNTIGESVRSNALLARNWLISNQNPDGGFSYGAFGITSSDTNTTAHAIIALLGTTWLLDPAPLTGNVTPPSTPSTSNNTGSEQTNTVASTADRGQVLSDTTPDKNQPKQNKKSVLGNIGDKSAFTDSAKNSPNYSLYGLLALGFIALGWFVIQSRQKQGV